MSTTTTSNVEILVVTPEEREQMRLECQEACRRLDEEFIAMMDEHNARLGVQAFSIN